MKKMKNLWYARFIRCILNAADELEKAGVEAVAAKDDGLFKTVHDMRMELWELSGELIKPFPKKAMFELLAEYTNLLMQSPLDAQAFLDTHKDNEDFVKLAETAKTLKEGFKFFRKKS